MLRFQSVGKSFGERRILQDLSYTFEPSKMYAIVGPSGSGKSTLLHLAAGLDKSDSGSVVLNGADLGKMSEDEGAQVRASGIGFVFQFFHFLNSLSLEKNVLLPSFLVGTANHARCAELFEQFGISRVKKSFPHEVSGGELQRAAIARALINNPSLILADEPTGNLDQAKSLEIFTLLQQLARTSDKTVVVVTHNRELAAFADQVLELKNYQLQ